MVDDIFDGFELGLFFFNGLTNLWNMGLIVLFVVSLLHAPDVLHAFILEIFLQYLVAGSKCFFESADLP